ANQFQDQQNEEHDSENRQRPVSSRRQFVHPCLQLLQLAVAQAGDPCCGQAGIDAETDHPVLHVVSCKNGVDALDSSIPLMHFDRGFGADNAGTGRLHESESHQFYCKKYCDRFYGLTHVITRSVTLEGPALSRRLNYRGRMGRMPDWKPLRVQLCTAGSDNAVTCFRDTLASAGVDRPRPLPRNSGDSRVARVRHKPTTVDL